MGSDKYALLSLPLSVEPSGKSDDVFNLLSSILPSDIAASTYNFPIPSFKIGTLDALVRQADELAKLDQQVEAAVAKGTEVLKTLLDGDETRMKGLKAVNDSKRQR